MQNIRIQHLLVKTLMAFLFFPLSGNTQEDGYPDIAAFVLLDSMTIMDQQRGFDVPEFIQLVREDESFYQAFHNLRTLSYQSNNTMRFFDRRGEEEASYKSTTQQRSDGQCRTMEVLDESAQGKFYKRNKEYRYYTAKMYDKVFFTHGRVCENEAEQQAEQKEARGLQKNYEELKQFIFQPGEKVDIPFIGGRTALFSEDMQQYYTYSITQKQYKDKFDAYVFSLQTKPEYKEEKEGKTIVKFMETYFDKNNFQVLGRRYLLEFNGVFSFDVYMEVELGKVGALYVPTLVAYKGEWNIPFKKKEVAEFSAEMSRFR